MVYDFGLGFGPRFVGLLGRTDEVTTGRIRMKRPTIGEQAREQ